MLKPCVGIVCVMSSSASFLRAVVLPALSRPRKRILAFLFAKPARATTIARQLACVRGLAANLVATWFAAQQAAAHVQRCESWQLPWQSGPRGQAAEGMGRRQGWAVRPPSELSIDQK